MSRPAAQRQAEERRVAAPSRTGTRVYVWTPTKSSPSHASRKTSSLRRRRYSIIGRPPSSGSHSCIECVAPAFAAGRAAFTAASASRWPAISPAIARSHEPMSCVPGGKPRAPRYPPNATTPGSLIVQYQSTRSPERPHDRVAVAGEPGRRARVQPPAPGRDPAGEREVVERHHRREAGLAHRVGHPPVVVELVLGERPLLGLDPRPLDRVAVRVQPEAASIATSSG